MVVFILIVVSLVAAALASADISILTSTPIISLESIRILKGISYYHPGYILSSTIILWFFAAYIYSLLPVLSLYGFISSIWITSTVFLARLENNEYTYQCQFGLSISAVRCEIYGNINRMLLLGTFQFLKYIRESFSFNDFNIFRILGFLSFLTTFVRRLISIVKPFIMLKLIINNSIVLAVNMVNAVYSMYNWREIVQGMIIEGEDEGEISSKNNVASLPRIIITRAKR